MHWCKWEWGHTSLQHGELGYEPSISCRVSSYATQPNTRAGSMSPFLWGPNNLRSLRVPVGECAQASLGSSWCTGSSPAFDDLMCLYPEDTARYSRASVTASDLFKTHSARLYSFPFHLALLALALVRWHGSGKLSHCADSDSITSVTVHLFN